MGFVRLLLFACLIASIGATLNSPTSVGYNEDGLFFNIMTGKKNILSFLNPPNRQIRDVDGTEEYSRILPSSIALDNSSLTVTFAPLITNVIFHHFLVERLPKILIFCLIPLVSTIYWTQCFGSYSQRNLIAGSRNEPQFPVGIN